MESRHIPCLSPSQVRTLMQLPPEERMAYIEHLLEEGKAWLVEVDDDEPKREMIYL